ncbi:MAG: alanine racemase [Planctomycetota bacterium]|jgi:alanine racemase
MLRIPVESRASRAASAWVEVDLGAVAHNVRVWRTALPETSRLLAVVKSDGYGHGMMRVARTALHAGADELVVACVQEGAALRAAGITARILIAGPIGPDEAAAVVQHGLVASLGSLELAQALSRRTRRYLPVHIEVDTGMTRHGVAPSELAPFVQAIHDRGRLSIAGVFSHFAGLGCHDEESMRQQLALFSSCVDAVPALRGVPRHICNSLGAMMLPEACLDAVRIGGGLYGFDPRRKSTGELAAMATGSERLPPSITAGSLLPALELKANVVGLREAQIGDRVGYGGAFTCQRPTRLALLPLGYGDGLSRESWRGAEVLVRGRRAPIVGEISMNQTVVDVTDLPQVVFGEEVVLIGAMGDQQIWAEERVPAGGCAYEVTSLLQSRLPRVFGLAGDSVEGRDAERGIRRDAEALRGRADRPSASSGSSNG